MFIILLKNKKLSSYNRLDQFILLLHFLYFIIYLIKTFADLNYIALVAGIVIAGTGLVLNTISITGSKKILIPFSALFFLLAMVWAALFSYWLCAALIVMSFLDYVVRKKQGVFFHPGMIEILSFPKKVYQWKDLSNVILKDNILTLDFMNDHLLQQEISEESQAIDEKEFNDFCKQQLQNKA